MRILVIDIGGSHVKFAVWGKRTRRDFKSGEHLTPEKMVARVLASTRDWQYDMVSIGFPGPVIEGKPAVDPPSLAKGWLRFNFEQAFNKPVKIINDAAMQALGSYREAGCCSLVWARELALRLFSMMSLFPSNWVS